MLTLLDPRIARVDGWNWNSGLVISVTPEPWTADCRQRFSRQQWKTERPFVTVLIDGKRLEEYTSWWIARTCMAFNRHQARP
jgi:hypothetical protein